MLVLSRKQNEKVIIGGNIVVTIVQIKQNQVRIGIQAPDNVEILREELVPTEDLPEAPANPPMQHPRAIRPVR